MPEEIFLESIVPTVNEGAGLSKLELFTLAIFCSGKSGSYQGAIEIAQELLKKLDLAQERLVDTLIGEEGEENDQ